MKKVSKAKLIGIVYLIMSWVVMLVGVHIAYLGTLTSGAQMALN